MRMIEKKVDVAIIGHGSAGGNAYRAVIAAGKTALIIEAGEYGTTCARVGCMPSKLLIAAADAAHSARNADVFGVVAGGVSIDGKAVMRRVREKRDFFVGFVKKAVEAIPKAHRLRGYARFLDDHTLQVGKDIRVHANAIIIATGSSPILPSFLASAKDRVLLNDDIFSWRDLPESIAVFGTGVIGLELGQSLARLGVCTTIFGRSGRVGPLTDPSLQKLSSEIFRAELDLVATPKNISVTKTEHGIRVSFVDERGKHREENYSFALSAVGRSANISDLGLENTTVQRGKNGVPFFDPTTMRCGEGSIFLAGDANGDLPLLHEASDEGEIAGKNAAMFPEGKSFPRRTPMAVVFTDPQMATCGQNISDLPEVVVGEVDFTKQGRAQVMAQNKGAMRLYFEKETGIFLASEMIVPRAEHFAHLLSWAIDQKLTATEMLAMPFYHPVFEEGIRAAIRDAAKKLP